MSNSQHDQKSGRDDHEGEMIAQATAPGAKEPDKTPRDAEAESDIDAFDEAGAGIAAKE